MVPHTRSMPDMLRVLDVLVRDDPQTRGDFWRHQHVLDLPRPSSHRPRSYLELLDPRALQGKRLGAPAVFLNGGPHAPIATRASVLDLWNAARQRLESLGAEVLVIDVPLGRCQAGRDTSGHALCMRASCVGWLIQAAAGSFGGWGRRFPKRSGWVA